MAQRPREVEWLVCVAFLPVLVTLTAIVVSTAMGWHKHRHIGAVSAIRSGADDYFQGLERLGIAKLPADERPPASQRRLITPMIAH
jgi:hypothetical protein